MALFFYVLNNYTREALCQLLLTEMKHFIVYKDLDILAPLKILCTNLYDAIVGNSFYSFFLQSVFQSVIKTTDIARVRNYHRLHT